MTRKSVTYYESLLDAMAVVRVMRICGDTEARAVRYDHGWAVQQRKSGPYWNAEKGCYQ